MLPRIEDHCRVVPVWTLPTIKKQTLVTDGFRKCNLGGARVICAAGRRTSGSERSGRSDCLPRMTLTRPLLRVDELRLWAQCRSSFLAPEQLRPPQTTSWRPHRSVQRCARNQQKDLGCRCIGQPRRATCERHEGIPGWTPAPQLPN